MTSSAFYRVHRVAEIYGVSVATIWRWAKTDPNFPQPIKISPGVTGWSAQAIEAHISNLTSGVIKHVDALKK